MLPKYDMLVTKIYCHATESIVTINQESNVTIKPEGPRRDCNGEEVDRKSFDDKAAPTEMVVSPQNEVAAAKKRSPT